MKLGDSRACIKTLLLEGGAFYSCRFLESQRFGFWTLQRSPLKSLKHHFSVVIVSFNSVGEQSAVVPGGVAAAAIGEAFTCVCLCVCVRACVCGSPVFRKHTALA